MQYSMFKKAIKEAEEVAASTPDESIGLDEALEQAFCDTFVTYFKAHSAHWNVVGDDFAAFHEFFSDLYEEIYSGIDIIAEQLRQVNAQAPYDLDAVIAMSNVSNWSEETDPRELSRQLYAANASTLASLEQACKIAHDTGNTGVENVLQDRISAHRKHAWMLKSTVMGPET